MTVKMKIKLLMLTLGLSLVTAPIVVAAGFGVSGGNTPQAAAINKLLLSSNSNVSSGNTKNATSNNQNSISQQNSVSSRNTQNATNNNITDNAFGDTQAGQSAFAQMIRNLMPLTPAQIKTLRFLFDQSQRAASTFPGTPPRPTSSTVLVNLSPGATPPMIRLRAGYVTALVFLDSTGQPWPIVAYDNGDPKAFDIEPNQPDGKSDTILVQALDTYKSGNLAVMLKGQNTPIMLTLLPGQRAVDYRVDLRVPGLGPNAKPIVNGLPNTGNPQLINFLDGVPPDDARAVQVTGGPCEAWVYDGKVFLRTRLTVLSPSWISTMSSPDGTHVYELTKTPVILASRLGQMTQLTIQGL